ncbi:PDF receptor [Nymphon striatum]|nr:PDF receptor [Nymphon striatum]
MHSTPHQQSEDGGLVDKEPKDQQHCHMDQGIKTDPCPGLRSHKTHIHKNLFLAMLLQVIVRLTIYIDKSIIDKYPNLHGIDNTDGVCEFFYVFLEYVKTVMFMWFLVEGLYLHQLVAVTITCFSFNSCWSYYSLTKYFWIIEGPRFFVISVNLLFLINTLKIIMTTIKDAKSTNPKKIVRLNKIASLPRSFEFISNKVTILISIFRKALKAGLVLVPLLGLTNVLQMVKAPLHRSAMEFGIWAFASHLLTSFQGVLVSLLYCFFSKEVKVTIKKRWRCYRARSMTRNDFGASMKSHVSVNYDPRRRSYKENGCKRNRDKNINNEETSYIRMSSFKDARKKMKEEKPKEIPTLV